LVLRICGKAVEENELEFRNQIGSAQLKQLAVASGETIPSRFDVEIGLLNHSSEAVTGHGMIKAFSAISLRFL
jgi:hypothetical protein